MRNNNYQLSDEIFFKNVIISTLIRVSMDKFEKSTSILISLIPISLVLSNNTLLTII